MGEFFVDFEGGFWVVFTLEFAIEVLVELLFRQDCKTMNYLIPKKTPQLNGLLTPKTELAIYQSWLGSFLEGVNNLVFQLLPITATRKIALALSSFSRFYNKVFRTVVSNTKRENFRVVLVQAFLFDQSYDFVFAVYLAVGEEEDSSFVANRNLKIIKSRLKRLKYLRTPKISPKLFNLTPRSTQILIRVLDKRLLVIQKLKS